MPLPTLRDGVAHMRKGAGGGTVLVAREDTDTKAELEGEPDLRADTEADTDMEGETDATDLLAVVEGKGDRDVDDDTDTLLDGWADGDAVVCTQNIKSVESKVGEYTHPYEAPCKEHVGPFTISHPGKRVLQITSAFSWMNAHVGWLAHDVLTDNDATEYPFTGIKAKAKAKTPTTRSIYFSMRYKREV